jgi:hypothetical protein
MLRNPIEFEYGRDLRLWNMPDLKEISSLDTSVSKGASLKISDAPRTNMRETSRKVVSATRIKAQNDLSGKAM